MAPSRTTAVAPTEGSGVKSARRTVKILEALAGSRQLVTMSELQSLTGYPRSSLHALVRTLRDLGWVESDETGAAFTVGPRALLAGTSYLDKDPALPHVHETLEDLRDELGYTFHYARRAKANVLYLASREARDHARTVSRVGRQLPAHITALGHALLAELTEAEIDDVLPAQLPAYTPETITDRTALHSHLETVRTAGWPRTSCSTWSWMRLRRRLTRTRNSSSGSSSASAMGNGRSQPSV
jgi:DNA-binding IclR family transcriptional regulator